MRSSCAVGKLATGLRITNLDGAPIGWAQALLRNSVQIVFTLMALVLLATTNHFVVPLPDPQASYGLRVGFWWSRRAQASPSA